MNRKGISWNVKQVSTMIGKESITFNNPVQRPSKQWKIADQSLLIHSILNMFVPEVYAIQSKTDNGNVFDVIDGKQRLTTINSYLNDEWALTDIPEVKLESTGETFDISGKKFSELPEQVQEEIKGYSLSFKIIELDENDDEEDIVDEIFYRLNNGKAVTRDHLALVSAKRNIQEFVRKCIVENPLFLNVAHYPEGDIKSSKREMNILQSIALVAGLDYKSFAAKDIEALFATTDIADDTLEKVETSMIKLAEAFNNEHNKFVTKINIPILVKLMADTEDTEMAQKFIKSYSETTKKGDNYRKYCGAGCTKVLNVTGRVNALQELYNSYNKANQKKVVNIDSNRTNVQKHDPRLFNVEMSDDWEYSSPLSMDAIPHSILDAAENTF